MTTLSTFTKLSQSFRFLFLSFLSLVFVYSAQAQSTTELLISGTSWTVPAGVYSVTVECWGGGGGGGGAENSSSTTRKNGSGGGGGGFSSRTFSVTPGNSLTYAVGLGGAAGSNSGGNGGNGGTTTFTVASTTITATGGVGGPGKTGSGSNAGPGGAGGSGSGGTANWSGGKGGDAGSGNSGGGGGAGRTTANGGAASNNIAGVGGGGNPNPTNGGNGGAGQTGGANGTAGNLYGGGGGAASAGLFGARPGGVGAAGVIRLTYCVAPINTNAGTDAKICNGSTVTLSGSANVRTTLFSENFESSPDNYIIYGNWSTYYVGSGDNYFIYSSTGAIAGSRSLTMYDGYAGTIYSYDKTWADELIARTTYPINAAGYSALKLNFKWKCAGEKVGATFYDYFQVVYSLNGTTWTNLPTIYQGQSATQTVANLDLSVVNNQSFYLGFRWKNDGSSGTNPPLTIDDISITGTPSAPTYTWSPAASLDNASIASPIASPTVTTTYTLTSTFSGCTASDQVTVNVLNPNAVRNAPTGPQCSGTTLNFSSSPVGGNGSYSYAWSATNPTTTGSSSSFSYAPVNTGASNITPTVTIAVTSDGLTCSQTFNPVIYPVPVIVSPPADITYCNAEVTSAIALSGTPSGVLFNYTGSGSNIGLSNGTGVSAISSFTATNSGASAISRTISITPTANGCSGSSVSYTITVNPTNKITTTLNNKAYCHNEIAPAIALAGTPSGVTFDVSGGASVGLANATGLTEIPSFTAVNPGTSPVVVTITVTPQANGCLSDAKTYDITVNPTPNFTTSVTDALCNGAANGTIEVTPTVGGAPFDYSKDNGVAYINNTTNPYTFTGLANGSYAIVVRDNGNCISAPQTVNVGQPNVLTASATNNGPWSTLFTATLNANQVGGTSPYSYSWSGPASFAPGNVQNPTRTPTTVNMTGTYKVTVTDVNGCTASASTVMNVYDGYVWKGTISTDWNNPNNWNHQAVTTFPDDCSRNSIIPSGTPFSPTVNVAGLTVGKLTIVDGAVLNLANDLATCSDLVGSATTLYSQVNGPSKLIMQGSSATVTQKISGRTKIETLQVNNSGAAGVEITGGNTQINTALELKSGNLKVANASRLTFLSNSASHSAVFDNFSTGFTGTFMNGVSPSLARAQRSYNATGGLTTFGFHHTSSPFNNLADTKFGANGVAGYLLNSDCDDVESDLGTPYGNVQEYDETNGAACSLEGWKTIKNTILQNGKGYAVKRNGAGTLTVDGAFNLNSSYTQFGLTNSNWTNTTLMGRTVTSGDHMVGNPYLAYLNVSNASHSANAGFTGTIYVWNTFGPLVDTYTEYQPATEDVVIPPFGAFWVKKTPGGTADYAINGSDRTRTETATFNKQTLDHVLYITAANTTTGKLDNARVAFAATAEATYEPQTDAEKMIGGYDRHSIYTNIGNMMMARNIHKSIEETSTIPMGFYVGATGNYELSFDGINTFDPTSYVYLEDKQTNAMHNIRNGNYSFSAVNTDAQDRFVLHFTPKAAIQSADATCNSNGQITIEQPGTATWNYTITDNANNTTMAQGTLNNSNPIAVAAPTGTYQISLTDNNGYQVVKNVQVNGKTPIVATMTANATMAEVDEPITLSNTTQGSTNQTWDMGNSVQFSTPLVNYSYPSEGVYTVTLSTINADGCQSTMTETITITQKTATSLSNLTKDKLKVWSYDNKVMVDFSKQPGDAVVIIYNLLGQEISHEPYNGNGVYSKVLSNNEVSYVIVRITQDGAITTKRLFIKNN